MKCKISIHPLLSGLFKRLSSGLSFCLWIAALSGLFFPVQASQINSQDNLTVSIDNVTHLEGNGGITAFIFTVKVTGSQGKVIIDYTTVDGTATTADMDYQLATGTLTFLSDHEETITVNVWGDTKIENDEIFSLNLSSTNIGINIDGTGTIINDDYGNFFPVITKDYDPGIFFDDFNTDLQWTPVPDIGATAGLDNNQYRLTHTIAGRSFLSIAPREASALGYDYTVEADMVLPNGGSDQIGLVFDRLPDGHYYEILIKPADQSYQLNYYDPSLPKGFISLTTGTSSKIEGTNNNHLKVLRDHGFIKVEVNGFLLVLTMDGQSLNGQVGVILQTAANLPAGSTAEVLFDNFLIKWLPIQTLYTDDFTTLTPPPNGWVPVLETGAVADLVAGEYHLKHVNPLHNVRSVAPVQPPMLGTKYSVEIDVRLLAPDQTQYGLIFDRLADNQYYRILIRPFDQSYIIERFDPALGFLQLVSGTSSYIRAGTNTNHLRLERLNGLIQVYVLTDTGLKWIFKITDIGYQNGQVGVIMRTPATMPAVGYAEAFFDNFLVNLAP